MKVRSIYDNFLTKSLTHTPNYNAFEIYSMLGDMLKRYRELTEGLELTNYQKYLISKEMERVSYIRHELGKKATIEFVLHNPNKLDYDANI